MTYTIGTAAKATGKSKSTISRDVKEGKISAVKNEDGSYSIDPSELHRVYDAVSEGNGSSNGGSNDVQQLNSAVGTGVLQAELERLREQLTTTNIERERERRQLTDQIEDYRRRLDAEGEERRKLTAILTDQRERAVEKTAEVEPVQVPERAKVGLFGRLFGRGS